MATSEETFTEAEVQPLSTATTTHNEEKTEEPIQIIPSKVSKTEETQSKQETKPIEIQPSTSTDNDNDETKPLKPKKDIILNIDRLNPNDIGDMNLIDRAHSDPLAMQSKQSNAIGENTTDNNNNELNLTNQRNSVFTSQKKYHSHDDILDTNKLGDFKGFNIREFSVEVIPIKYDNGRQEKKEEIIVPARDNLVKIPFYSTPLTLESTNNAFFDFRERLNEMGFIEQSEAALIHTQCESVENAVAFILNNMDAIYHRFDTGEINITKSLESINEMNSLDENIDINYENKASKICKLCNKSFDEHLIDEKGNKIKIGINENNYNHSENVYELNEEENSLILEEDIQPEESVKIEFKGIDISSEKINEIISKTMSELEPPKVYTGPTEQCLICFENKPIDFYVESECGHDMYCKECLTQHYKIKTKEGDVLKVKCIDPSCEREIKEEEILNFLLDDELKNKFRKFKRQKLLMLNENARFCPKIDCEGYMIGSRLKPKLACPECSTIICFNCSKLWHGYFTKCSSAQNASAANETDKKYYQWELNKDVKKCPKCKMRIEKNEGCNHMTCISCKYEFCWVCKGKYNSNHFSQWNIFGCPGAQYNNRGSICSIQRCPSCMPMWLRRLLIIIAVILLLPIIIVFGVLAGCVYGCAICVVFIFENVCGCC